MTDIVAPQPGDLVSWSKGMPKILKDVHLKVLDDKELEELLAIVVKAVTWQEGEDLPDICFAGDDWDSTSLLDRRKAGRACIRENFNGRYLKGMLVDESLVFIEMSDAERDRVLRARIQARITSASSTRKALVDPFSVEAVKELHNAEPTQAMQLQAEQNEWNKSMLLLCKSIGIDHPHKYQVDAIMQFLRDDIKTSYLFRRTADGKSAVFCALSTMLARYKPGVSVFFFPLKMLAMDQELKIVLRGMPGVRCIDLLSEGEIKECMAAILDRDRGPREHPVILTLTEASFEKLGHYLKSLFKEELINLLVLDEGNMLVDDGRSYRKELLEVRDKLVAKLPDSAKIVVATATCDEKMHKDLQEVTGTAPCRVMWGPMTKRNVFLRFQVTGRYRASQIKKLIKHYLSENPDLQVLVFTNHSKKANAQIRGWVEAAADELVEEKVLDWDVSKIKVVTGEEGDMWKQMCIDRFANGQISVIICTEACKAGISSDCLNLLMQSGLAANVAIDCQLTGRTGRLHTLGTFPQTTALQNISDAAQFAARGARSTAGDDQKKKEWDDYLHVLWVRLCHDGCWHQHYEDRFSCPSSLVDQPHVMVETDATTADPCVHCCGHCSGERDSFFRTVRRKPAIETLTALLTQDPTPTLIELVDVLPDALWVDSAKNEIAANAFVLQLLCLRLTDTDAVLQKHSQDQHVVRWKLPRVVRQDGTLSFALHDQSLWSSIPHVEE